MTVVVAALLFGAVGPAHAGYYYVKACSVFGNRASAYTASATAAHLSPSDECMVWSGSAYRSLEINEVFGSVLKGYDAQWSTTTPSPAIAIVNAFTPVNTVLVDCILGSDGFTAQYFWGGGGKPYGAQSINYINGCSGGVGYADGINRSIPPSRDFGWSVGCWLKSTCNASDNGALLAVNGIQLEAEENTGPGLLAFPSTNLYYHSGWVRGAWPLTLAAGDPSGVCSMETVFDGQALASWTDPRPDQSSWTQCHGSVLSAGIDTAKYANGHHSLSFVATNAAGVASTAPRGDGSGNPVLIDNAPVGLSLSGPTDAPSTAGTQHVTAVATAGPSGVAGIACSTDGAPYQWHPGLSVALPVSGLGQHHVACYAQNNSLNVDGIAATSPVQNWTMSIRTPTELGIGFTKIVDALRCSRVRERIMIPAQWVTVRRDHKLVTVYESAHLGTVTVVRCHPRTARRRVVVWVTIMRHGRKVLVKRVRTERVILPPHVVSRISQQVAFGNGGTVDGWLGTSTGAALGGEAVSILGAPDNGQGRFAPLAIARTHADGSWTAHLPPGPSRLIEAVYAGSPADEPATSGQVKTVVPAKVKLGIRPGAAHWGGKIEISGRVLGGYVPPAGELVVLWIGWPGGSTEIGHLYARSDGRFSSTYTFLRGNGTETYRLWAVSARESDYPFTPTSSPSVAVTVTP